MGTCKDNKMKSHWEKYLTEFTASPYPKQEENA